LAANRKSGRCFRRSMGKVGSAIRTPGDDRA
jgi:hypothetical protein